MKLKVCGMHHNTLEVASLTPDYLGFIFWEDSPRHYGRKEIPELPTEITAVGVFVDAPMEFVLGRVRDFGFGAVQLHGKESPKYCRDLKKNLQGLPPVELIKAFPVGDTFDFTCLDPYLAVTDYFMFDTKGILPGGNSRTFDWTLLGEYPFEHPFFLSGGIAEAHCEKLLDFVRNPQSRFCHAIDVNSAFETRPGEKDTYALGRFLQCDFWKEAGHPNI
ncbi:MAG: phosphoribosylanthranilate isomerase [Bacteroidetes bacterium]|jgi:phosphoribosylanthranilate isomerase|nr:MAG: phosphoribosylanthranilate isomerase [Bacteroidota bacterium]UCE69973.1 MAG: phosphoribosylanthranilate isomerase [Flavobacteriaceae bacterium]